MTQGFPGSIVKIRGSEDLERVRKASEDALYGRRAVVVTVGLASCGIGAGARASYALARKTYGPDAGIEIRRTGCIGFCEEEPLVEVEGPEGPRLLFRRATQEKILQMIEDYRQGAFDPKGILGQIRDRRSLLEEEGEPLPGVRVPGIPLLEETPFYRDQLKIALRNCGYVDPERIEDYIVRGGYRAFFKALEEMSPGEILRCVKDSGLRGRGGGGFPTGLKWETCARHHGERVVICNADEGDPGAYMDRSILEGDPHSVLEGMLIAARAIGSSQGYIYVRHEYPLAVERLMTAIAQAEALGLLGEGIGGTDFSFRVRISTGAGAFVCGESTALMGSLEGKVGRPRAKYVHTVEKGFRNQPSNLNNVETYANVPVILLKGAPWYAGIGTEKSKGTKVFSLVGKVRNTGLVEIPMGMSLRHIVYEIGGGIPRKRAFKAVQTGGPSGGCIPEQYLDLGVDFDALARVGSIMGSGGMIVMDRETCMVDVARYFLQFLEEESCGQCNPCREGIRRMLQILDRICRGEGREGDIELLEEVGRMVQGFSLCGLGTSAPNPVMTTIRYFRDEYEAHIREKRCPAGVCKALYHYEIDPEACTGCHVCALKCPQKAIAGEKKGPHTLDRALCIQCGICYEACRFDAVVVR